MSAEPYTFIVSGTDRGILSVDGSSFEADGALTIRDGLGDAVAVFAHASWSSVERRDASPTKTAA